jgi:subtilisin-like proprotein convertase family protein
MKTPQSIILVTLLAICSPPKVWAQLVESPTFTGINTAVPDGNAAGLTDTHEIVSDIASITELKVSLTISGASAFNGDLYAYVTHDSGFSVLLNRPGRTASDQFGYDDSGINVVFQDSAPLGDAHTYRLTLTGSVEEPIPTPGILTGTWAADGRNVLPSAVLDTTARTALLSSFAGQSASGTWTLFIADVSAGGSAQLQSWGLEITGTAVPEPVQTTVATALALASVAALRRWRAHARNIPVLPR